MSIPQKSRPDEPMRKPMVRAARVALFEREVKERLSEPAVEILLGAATVLSEGDSPGPMLPLGGTAVGTRAWFGSTMLTIELGAIASSVREPLDEAAARRVAELLTTDGRIARSVRRIAEREASRLAGDRVLPTATEVRVRAAGTTLYIDADVEGELAPRRAAAAGGPRG